MNWRVGHRVRFVVALAAVLWFSQLLLAIHGLEHLYHADDDGHVCAECLALAGTTAATPSLVQTTVPVANAAVAIQFAVPPAPTFRQPVHFLSRAPPASQS